MIKSNVLWEVDTRVLESGFFRGYNAIFSLPSRAFDTWAHMSCLPFLELTLLCRLGSSTLQFSLCPVSFGVPHRFLFFCIAEFLHLLYWVSLTSI